MKRDHEDARRFRPRREDGGERSGEERNERGSEEGRKGGVGSFFNRVLRVCWTIFGVHGVHANTYVLYRWSVHGWGTPFFSSLFELFYLFLLLPFVSLPFFFSLSLSLSPKRLMMMMMQKKHFKTHVLLLWKGSKTKTLECLGFQKNTIY